MSEMCDFLITLKEVFIHYFLGSLCHRIPTSYIVQNVLRQIVIEQQNAPLERNHYAVMHYHTLIKCVY